MRILALMILMVVGCATLTPEQKALRDSVVGEYEYKNKDGYIIRYVLLKNGVLQIRSWWSTLNAPLRESSSDKWKVSNGEIHITNVKGGIGVFRINKDSSITFTALINDGKREEVLKEEDQTTFKIIK